MDKRQQLPTEDSISISKSGGEGAGNIYAQTEALRQRNHDVGLGERTAGVPTPVRTIETDPDIRRCRSNELFGLQMVQVGVTGNGNVAIGDAVVHTEDDSFRYVGSSLLANRAHPYAGGSSSVSTYGNGAPPPKITAIGGGCSGPSSIKVEPRRNYRILIAAFNHDTDTNFTATVGNVSGTYTEASSQAAAMTSVLPWNNDDGPSEAEPGGADGISYAGYFLEIIQI